MGDRCSSGILINDILGYSQDSLFKFIRCRLQDINRLLENEKDLTAIYEKKYLVIENRLEPIKRFESTINNFSYSQQSIVNSEYNIWFPHHFDVDIKNSTIHNYEYVTKSFDIRIQKYKLMMESEKPLVLVNFYEENLYSHKYKWADFYKECQKTIRIFNSKSVSKSILLYVFTNNLKFKRYYDGRDRNNQVNDNGVDKQIKIIYLKNTFDKYWEKRLQDRYNLYEEIYTQFYKSYVHNEHLPTWNQTPYYLYTRKRYEHVIIATPDRRRIQQTYYNDTFPFATVYPAVLGNKLNIDTVGVSDHAKKLILENYRTKDSEMNHINSVGCALAHYATWRRCIDMDCPIMVMEDDVKLKVVNISDTRYLEIFHLLQDGNTIVYLLSLFHSQFFKEGYNKLVNCENTDRFKSIDKELSKKHQHTGSIGAQCYIISPNVAKKLVTDFYPIEYHVDHYLSEQIQKHHLTLYVQKQDKLLFDFDDNEKIRASANCNFYQPLSMSIPLKLIWLILVIFCVFVVYFLDMFKRIPFVAYYRNILLVDTI